MRAWQVNDRVSSIATSYPGPGRIIRIGFGTIEVRWPDGSWSRERPQDLIFGGRDEDPVTPFGANIPEPTFNQGWGRLLPSFNAESFAAPDYTLPLNPQSQTREEYSKDTLVGVINPTMEVLPQPWGSGSLESILTPERTGIIRERGVPNSLVENFPIYERMYEQSRQPGAAIPMIAKGVVF
jgi:hypothetical protein|tara:strand:+ start:3666 stop:4211 length:546 start_codon:yes stop_codon:yes gene_type:complete